MIIYLEIGEIYFLVGEIGWENDAGGQKTLESRKKSSNEADD